MTLTLLSDKIFRPKSLRSFHLSIIHPKRNPGHTAPTQEGSFKATVGLAGSQVIICCLHRPTHQVLAIPAWNNQNQHLHRGHIPSPAPGRSMITLHDASPSSSRVFQWSSTGYTGTKSISPPSPKKRPRLCSEEQSSVRVLAQITTMHHLQPQDADLKVTAPWGTQNYRVEADSGPRPHSHCSA